MYLGKNQKLPLAILHPWAPYADTFFQPDELGLPPVSLVLQIESFKVIALDKKYVNSNFPQLLWEGKPHLKNDLWINGIAENEVFA